MKRRHAYLVAFSLLTIQVGPARTADSAAIAGATTRSEGAEASLAVKTLTTAPTTRPALSLLDADGQTRLPLEIAPDQHAAVLLFIATDCPISNSYAQEFARLVHDYRGRGFAIYFIYSSPGTTATLAKAHARQFGLTSTLLLDPDCALAQRVGAVVTPEVVVVGSGEQVLYRGRIDDLYYALGKRRFEATHHDLREALDAIADGKPAPNPRTQPVGCAIGS